VFNAKDSEMRAAISGINGFIGRRLRLALETRSWEVVPLQRQDFSLGIDKLSDKISGSDVVIHLAGAPIVHRWSRAYKHELQNSRIITTRKLVEAISSAKEIPALFISTSAIGIYSSRGRHTETMNEYGGDFIAKLCRDWETEASNASTVTRTVIFRLGIVLAKDGGAFPKMLLPFRLGFGGKIGNGKQGFSWIHIDDLISAYVFSIENKQMNGAFNLTSPEPNDNEGFTRILSGLIRRPAVINVPVFALKLIYGEGSQAVAGGQSVFPERLIKEGFKFNFTSLESTLENILR
jgi:uncharacterized protein